MTLTLLLQREQTVAAVSGRTATSIEPPISTHGSDAIVPRMILVMVFNERVS